jgi:hypothetical protein
MKIKYPWTLVCVAIAILITFCSMKSHQAAKAAEQAAETNVEAVVSDSGTKDAPQGPKPLHAKAHLVIVPESQSVK